MVPSRTGGGASCLAGAVGWLLLSKEANLNIISLGALVPAATRMWWRGWRRWSGEHCEPPTPAPSSCGPCWKGTRRGRRSRSWRLGEGLAEMGGWQKWGAGRAPQPLASGQVPVTGLGHGSLTPGQQGHDRVLSNSSYHSVAKQRARVLCAGGVSCPTFPPTCTSKSQFPSHHLQPSRVRRALGDCSVLSM